MGNIFNRRTINKASFFIFLFSILNVFAQSITKGPYLADPKNNLIIIRWESNAELSFIIKYGKDNKLSNNNVAKIIDTSYNRYLYEAIIDGLVPNQKYLYQVVADTLKSEIESFKCNIKKPSILCNNSCCNFALLRFRASWRILYGLVYSICRKSYRM